MAAVGQVAASAAKAVPKVPGWAHFVPIGDPRGLDHDAGPGTDDERARWAAVSRD